MTDDPEARALDALVHRMLESETFAPDELAEVLARKGHDEAAVAQSIERVRTEIAAKQQSSAHQMARRRRKRAGRLVQLGVMFLAVGFVFVLLKGGGFLVLLLVVAIGGALIAAGYRGLRG